MRFKKIVLLFLFIIILGIICIVLYNKTYCINLEANNVYEIKIITSYPYNEKTITDREEIDKYLEAIQKVQFTHPTFFAGKGWETFVIIKIKNTNDVNIQYQYMFINNYIQKGSFRYRIISK